MELSATFLFKVICNGEETAGFEIFQDPGIIDKCELVSVRDHRSRVPQVLNHSSGSDFKTSGPTLAPLIVFIAGS